MLGLLRSVLFAPEDLAMVKGDPAERRRFLDELLVARAPRFAGVRADYERVLKQRGALEPELRAALGGDALAQLLGIGPLGLFELKRARIHPPLHEVLADAALARGLALLRRAMREAKAAPQRRLAVMAPPAVLDAIRTLPGALEEYAAMAGPGLKLRAGMEEDVLDA